MCAILLGMLVLSVEYTLAAEIVCSDGNKTNTTFTPCNDGMVGRYLAEWCINVDPKTPLPTNWSLQLTYFQTDHYCIHPPKTPIYSQGKVHSFYTDTFIVDNDCTHVCLSATVDLVFKACYLLKTYFMVNNLKRYISDQFFNIENEYSEETFKNNTALVDVIHHDKENVTMTWHTGVPFHSCDFELTLKNTTMGETRLLKVEAPTNCTAPSQIEVKCYMRLRPGQYHTQLSLYAPWMHGVFRDQQIVIYDFNVTTGADPTLESSHAWLWTLVGVLIALGIFFVAVGCVCRSRRARAVRKKVLERWILQGNESSPVPPEIKPQRHILMLYAREGEVASKFCAAMRDMLQEAPDTKVYDIFSPEVMAMAATGPHAWIREMLMRENVAVLLLQTPALAALYQQHLQDNDTGVRLQEPLLGRRMLYRAPQYGDTLLQYAVMLTAEAAHARSNYRKYYVATLSELPIDIFPQLVPFRRYSLPACAPLLAQNMCDFTPSQQSVNTVCLTAKEFVDLAKDNPGYLKDELMVIP